MRSSSSQPILRLGTRGSLLARTQSGLVAEALQSRHPELRVELTVLKTSGDQITDRPLHEFGGKGLFTKELEQALLAGQIDFAVHSFKDVPVTMPLVEQGNLIIAAVPAREDPRDVLVSDKVGEWADLPQGARVGTGSLRRRCQILDLRPDLRVEGVRGNIDTRLRKLREGEFDAVVLAFAGLKRTGLFDPATMSVISPDLLLPAAGQGALALQCRRDDPRTIEWLSVLNDPDTAMAVTAERELVRLLEGDCHSPIAAMAQLIDGRIEMRAAIGRREGAPPVCRAAARGSRSDPHALAAAVFQSLAAQGAPDWLRRDR